jgi:hypothetical protein
MGALEKGETGLATTEYENVSNVTIDDPDDDPVVIHLYSMGSDQVAACGVRVEEDRHRGRHGYIIKWEKGMMSCPVCAAPICMDCLLEAS